MPVRGVAFLKLGPEVVRDPAAAAAREWLIADGLGGYASSTPLGMNTRRYHGLLVAALRPPVGRMVLLSRLEEALVIGTRRYELGTSAYKGAVHPRGFELASEFVLDPLPSLTFELEGARLRRTIARIHGEPGTAILYEYEGAEPAQLELRPLLAYRPHHALQHENASLQAREARQDDDIVLEPYEGCPPLHLRVPRAAWTADGYWYRQFEYQGDADRGYDCHEDLFSPGWFSVPLEPGATASFLAWAGAIPPARDATAMIEAEVRRLTTVAAGEKGLLAALRRAADAFLVRRGEAGLSILEGYPWFADAGRTAMIGLPGLCLVTGRHDEARAILAEFASQVEDGLIPSRFPDGGEEPPCDAADAPLWMTIAVRRFLDATSDLEFAKGRLLPALFAIVDGYRAGTRHGIGMNHDGLIEQGEAGLALTWMDARIAGRPVTPRRGLAVEIQALWYNALRIGADLARTIGENERAAAYEALAGRARDTFLRLFWDEEKGCLADVVAGGVRHLEVRPNQLYAIGLPHALLPRDKAERVLGLARRHLLTPLGLRTLAPFEPGYRASCTGEPDVREGAAHQGSVWPFLMGIYVDALVRVFGEEGRREAREWLAGFAFHLEEAGLGFVSEVCDGDPPHRPGGAPAHALSVAELLRVAAAARRSRPPDPELGL